MKLIFRVLAIIFATLLLCTAVVSCSSVPETSAVPQPSFAPPENASPSPDPLPTDIETVEQIANPPSLLDDYLAQAGYNSSLFITSPDSAKGSDIQSLKATKPLKIGLLMDERFAAGFAADSKAAGVELILCSEQDTSLDEKLSGVDVVIFTPMDVYAELPAALVASKKPIVAFLEPPATGSVAAVVMPDYIARGEMLVDTFLPSVKTPISVAVCSDAYGTAGDAALAYGMTKTLELEVAEIFDVYGQSAEDFTAAAETLLERYDTLSVFFTTFETAANGVKSLSTEQRKLTVWSVVSGNTKESDKGLGFPETLTYRTALYVAVALAQGKEIPGFVLCD